MCHETKFSRRLRQDDEWEPDWTDERFSAFLECDETTCGEMVVVSGDTEVVPEPADDGLGHVLVTVLRPQSMTPAPPLFPLGFTLPWKVSNELKLAFHLYWADRGSCVSRLRTSLEVLLDDKGIKRDGVSAKSKPYLLGLAERIDLFEQKFGDADNAESMHALRIIGNLGTHGGDIDSESLFDAMDVYEDALLEIYEGKTAKLKAKKLKLKSIK